MSSTTQILFNSPALHSLKRDQLVKLCKIHSIKASGKNVDLIEKLKRHAETLPKDDPLSIAVRGESNENDNDSELTGSSPSPSPPEDRQTLARPSEQWEVVMDSIAEEDENSQGTIGSTKTFKGTAGEFGTGSTKSSTVTSSIRALATSLGLKRAGPSKSTVSSLKSSNSTTTTGTATELEKNSTPYSALPSSDPPVEEQPLAFNPSRMSMNGFLAEGETPLPGHALRPGLPAPANARLSMGLGLTVPATPFQPTTTIRLVANRTPPQMKRALSFATPQLKPFHTTFDLIMGSPSPTGGIYPTLTFSDLPPAMPTPSRHSPGPSRMEGILNTPNPNPKLNYPAGRTPEPFVFGSPLPQHRVSDVQFRTAAASVLEEMNKRLQQDGVEGVDTSVISRLHPGTHSAADVESRELKPLPRMKGEFKGKFDQKHDEEFQKMEGIDGFVKRRGISPNKDEVSASGPVVIGKKRKSSVVALNDGEGPRRPIGARRASGTRVVSKKLPKAPIPGAFGDDDDEEEVDERAGKRIRVASDSSQAKGSSVGVRVTQSEQDKIAQEKERQAIKRKLELNKAKRRSSGVPGGMQGRRSGRISGGLAQKPKPSRFGFLSSAKSLVQSVWGRNKTATATSNAIPKPTSGSGAATDKKVPAGLLKKAAATAAKPSTALATATSSRVPSVKLDAKTTESHLTRPTAASSARSRSPIPAFGSVQSTRSSFAQNGFGTLRSPTVGPTITSRKNSVSGTARSRVSSANVSSIGTRLSSARMSSMGATGSMGTKKPSLTPAGRPSNTGSSSSRLSTSSRLLAPTASSLAKSNRTSAAGLKSVAERPKPASSLPVRSPPPSTPMSNGALSVITNTPAAVVKSPGPFSPTRGKIFSRPLDMSGIPTPAKRPVQQRTNGPSSITVGGDETKASEGPSRQRSLNGRKPRISRSKVIARLASQRAAGGSSNSTNNGTPRVAPRSAGPKARSSLGAKVAARSSLGGIKNRASGGGDVLMSAKKRARQSEYMRRRSRVEALTLSPGGGGAMDVDER